MNRTHDSLEPFLRLMIIPVGHCRRLLDPLSGDPPRAGYIY